MKTYMIILPKEIENENTCINYRHRNNRRYQLFFIPIFVQLRQR